MRELTVAMSASLGLAAGILGVEARAATASATARSATVAVAGRPSPERILRHFRALTGLADSADRTATMRGVEAGGDPAPRYIATQFMSYGLMPAGDDGTYFRSVPMTVVRTLPETSFTAVSSDLNTLALGNLEDVVTNDQTETPSAYIDAPVVFAGYGIEAPEYGRDDYKGLSVDGKVVLLLAGEPTVSAAGLGGHAPTHYGSPEYKFAESARRGAVAVLLVPESHAASETWRTVLHEWGKARFYRRGDATPRLHAASWIKVEAARRVAAMAGLDLDGLIATAQGNDFTPVALPLRLQGHVASEVRTIAARNVVAALPGRGAASREAVLYTARYDGLQSVAATGPTELEDDRSGTATGIATLLEAARLWSQRSTAPPRTILFVALSGVDQGFPAADSFVATGGAVPPGRISLALTLEPGAPHGGAPALVASGAPRTSFAATAAKTAQSLGLLPDADPYPAAERDYGAGAYRLALAGIPSLSLRDRTPAIEPVQRRQRTPPGHFEASNFASDATLARFGYELGLEAATQRDPVAWVPGDEFEAARKSSQQTPHNKPLERKPRRAR